LASLSLADLRYKYYLNPTPPGPVEPVLPTLTGLRLHLDASSLSLADGAPVDVWTDKSPNGYSPTSTGGLRPVFKTNILNGRPVVRFDGSLTQNMVFPATPSAIMAAATAGTILFVKKIIPHGTSETLSSFALGAWGTMGSTDHWPYVEGTLYTSWGAQGRTSKAGVGAAMEVAKAYCIVSAPLDWRIYFGGGPVFHFTTDNTVQWNSTLSATLGRDLRGSIYFTGEIAEVVAYNRKLTSAEINQVGAYLNTKWGVPWAAVA